MLRDPDQFGPFLDVNIVPADDGSCSGIFTYQTMEAMSCAATSLERRQMDGWALLLRARCWRPPVGWWWPRRWRDRIPRATTPEERESEGSQEEQVERRVKAPISGAHLWCRSRGEPPEWRILARSQGHQTYATVLWGKDSSQAERPILRFL